MKVTMILALILMWSGFLATKASAELEETLISDGWDEIKFEDLPENIFTAVDEVEGLSRQIQVTSEGSISIAFLNIKVDLNDSPYLEWSWQSLTQLVDTDTTKKSGDDRTLAIYIAFPYQPDEASFGDKVRRQAIELLRGPETPDRILTYIWGGGADRGEKIQNPYAGKNGQFIYLRTPKDEKETWFTERVNIQQDFIDAFGFEPVSPVYVGIGSDSDDTGIKIRARVKGLRFSD